MDSSLELGYCQKNKDQVVLEQNQLCIEMCGNLQGQRCEKACMKAFAEVEKNQLFKLGIHSFNNIKLEEQRVDAVVINDGRNITTHFLPLDKLNAQRLAEMKEKNLSAAETKIVKLVLEGFSNSEIAEKLFISKATLKTHLNNIYKKVPPEMRPFRPTSGTSTSAPAQKNCQEKTDEIPLNQKMDS